MVPESIGYTPVRALMSVDLPAPFSPMRVWTSPARSEKSTASSALTPGNEIVMPRISTTGGTSTSAMVQVLFVKRGRRGPRVARSPADWCWCCLVGTGREQLDGVLLRERAIGHDLGLRDIVAGDDLLHEVGHLLTEDRVALHDVVELAVGQGLHAVVHRIDRDDLDVDAGNETRGFDGVERTETHVVVVGEEHLDLRAVLLQEALHDLLATVTGEVTRLRVEHVDRGALDRLVEAGRAVERCGRTRRALEHDEVG